MFFIGILNLIRLKMLKFKLLIFVLVSVIWTAVPQRLSSRIYNYRLWLYRQRKWEQGGRFYEKYFHVKAWKSHLPDIGDIFKWRFSKRHLQTSACDYIQKFLAESCKAEFAHWMIIVSSFVFVLLGSLSAFFEIFSLSAILNLPYIIIQRYNRPRLIRLLQINAPQHYESCQAKA